MGKPGRPRIYFDEKHLAQSRKRRERYRTDKEFREKARASARKFWLDRRQWLDDYRSALTCAECGDDRPWVLDFHHTDPAEKSFKIALIRRRYRKQEDIDNELSKCIVLCANCHRDLHHRLDTTPTDAEPATTPTS